MRVFTIVLLVFLTSATYCQSKPNLTVDKIFKEYHFHPNAVERYRSMVDGEHYTVLESGKNIVSYDYRTGSRRSVILDGNALPDTILSIHNYEFCRDDSKILMTTYVKKMYRHSFQAIYWIYDVASKTTSRLYEGRQQLATFSPDGKKIAFVKNNNLYYKDLVTQVVIQVTKDGEFNEIINGAPDWVYEEEFGFSKAFAWSPDSRIIGYYRFDESMVREFDMMVYDDLYPSVDRFKYPKAGESNSVVSVHAYHLETGNTFAMNSGIETDQYIVRIKWSADPGKLGIIRLNRLQNVVDVLLADAFTGKSNVIYHEENPRYLSRIGDDYIHFLNDKNRFIIMSERSGNYHYYLHSIDGSMINPITRGNWEVIALLGIDEINSTIYYKSNQSSVINQDVYSIRFDGKAQRKLFFSPGHNESEFNSTFKYYVNVWSDANTPPVHTLHTIDGKELRVIEDNSYLNSELKRYGFAKKEFIRVPVPGNVELFAYIIKPADFDSTRQYPVLFTVYGGPQSQEVVNKWESGIAWQQLLTTKGYIIACVDNRGTDGRGEDFRKCTYMQLGKLETEDQIAAAQYLAKKSWIDKNRIGIWGWSYGGYMTLLCMTKGAGVFKTGIAVAPVTNWRFYDNIYTERFMRKPQENPTGYDDNSPINHASKLKGNLLLIHGMADDNVHLQNSVAMADRLIMENKQFQQFMYPNRNHNINGGNTRHHLYSMMTDYILKNL
jgi:dipeptidyl-peptidase-4